MQMSDVIADMLTRIRNANNAKHPTVDIPASNMKKAIARILVEEGYVKSFQVIDDGKQGIIRITLKYLRHPPGLQARSADLRQLRGYAQRYERPGNCDCFHIQGHYDRQKGARAQCGRRGPGVCVVIGTGGI